MIFEITENADFFEISEIAEKSEKDDIVIIAHTAELAVFAEKAQIETTTVIVKIAESADSDSIEKTAGCGKIDAFVGNASNDESADRTGTAELGEKFEFTVFAKIDQKTENFRLPKKTTFSSLPNNPSF